jgi:hypothetical protein
MSHLRTLRRVTMRRMLTLIGFVAVASVLSSASGEGHEMSPIFNGKDLSG